MFGVFAVLIISTVLYFGYIYGFLANISEKERQQLSDLEAKMPELSSVIAEAEKDGKITTLEYWEIVDVYREKQQEEYKKTLTK
jgi:hypothetical protein